MLKLFNIKSYFFIHIQTLFRKHFLLEKKVRIIKEKVSIPFKFTCNQWDESDSYYQKDPHDGDGVVEGR